MADLIEKLVGKWLPEADVAFLTERCTEFNIAVPGDKADNQHYLVKLINRHLFSEALEQTPDNGKGVWLKLFGELGELLGKGAPKVEAPEPEPLANNNAPANGAPADVAGAVAQATVDLSFHKMREFKINGTVDGGKDGTLQYVSLFSQIKLGQAAKYTTAEIIYGVIRAIPASSSFRTLLESNLEIDMPEFIKMLRSHYKEQDSDSALLELKDCYQKPDQGAHDFCCRAIFLRDRLAAIALEEGSPWGADKLKKRLVRTITTGLKQNSIKVELQPYLSEDSELTDREFLEKVALAEVHESERLGKLKAKETEINSLQLTKKGGPGQTSQASAKNKSAAAASAGFEVPPEMKEFMTSVSTLTVKLDKLVSTTSAQSDRINSLEKMLTNPGASPTNVTSPTSGPGSGNQSGNSGNDNNNRRRVFKCVNCVAQNVGYCPHCFKCLSDQHKKADCPN